MIVTGWQTVTVFILAVGPNVLYSHYDTSMLPLSHSTITFWRHLTGVFHVILMSLLYNVIYVMFYCCWICLFTDSIMYQYFVKIVPTAYVKIDGQVGVFVPFDIWWFFSRVSETVAVALITPKLIYHTCITYIHTVWVKKNPPLRFSEIFSQTVGNF